jgi:hypothetical protein
MTLTDNQLESFNEAVRPAIKWLAENVHPHTAITITSTGAELFEGITTFNTDEYLKD